MKIEDRHNRFASKLGTQSGNKLSVGERCFHMVLVSLMAVFDSLPLSGVQVLADGVQPKVSDAASAQQVQVQPAYDSLLQILHPRVRSCQIAIDRS